MDKRVERYLTDNMNDAEKAIFEEELMGNSDLEKEVEESRIAITLIRKEGRTRLKQRLVNLDKGDTTITSPNRLMNNHTVPWLLGLLGFAFIGCALFFWYNSEEVKNNSLVKPAIEAEREQVENIPAVKDSVVIQKESPIKEETPKTSSSKINNRKTPQKTIKKQQPIAKEEVEVERVNRIFAQSFEPYRHPSLRPNVRGAGDASSREKFELAYWEKDYSQVLNLWESLSETQKNNGNLLFLKAVSTMEKGRVKEAEQDFQQLLNLKRHRFVQQSEWYLALVALHENDIPKTKKLLLKIIENTRHPLNQEAIDLIKTIK